MQNILVAVDGSENSERALDTAIGLTRSLDGSLFIINVLDEFWDATDVWKKHGPMVLEVETQHDQLLKREKERAEEELGTGVETFRADGNAVEQILKMLITFLPASLLSAPRVPARRRSTFREAWPTMYFIVQKGQLL